jgi:hypothetical protein
LHFHQVDAERASRVERGHRQFASVADRYADPGRRAIDQEARRAARGRCQPDLAGADLQ